VAIEAPDFVVVVEAPLNEKRSIAVIDEVHRLIPDKPIRYLVNTHDHFDHAGGMRTYAAEGATIVTSSQNRDFYERAVLSTAPRTLDPDRLSLVPPDRWPSPLLGLVTDKYVISDRGQEVVVGYPLPAFDHAAEMVVAYVPRLKMVINRDVYGPPAQGKPLPKPNAAARVLLETIQRLGLDVSTHVGLHGGVGPEEDLVKIVGQPTTN
jgi:glyoxylase-like metal-dependent hydrolase (beta-lactamase superfamily II)